MRALLLVVLVVVLGINNYSSPAVIESTDRCGTTNKPSYGVVGVGWGSSGTGGASRFPKPGFNFLVAVYI